MTQLENKAAAYRLFLKEKQDAAVITELALQYGFVVVESVTLPPGTFLIGAKDKVAMALERDPRVERVQPTANPLNISQ